MNRLERVIYDAVKHNPRWKFAIRNLYQRLMDLFPAPHPQSAYPITQREGYFFGFHDHTPFSGDNGRLLSNRFTIPLRMPRPGEALEVGYFHGPGYVEYKALTETKAWTWHIGCKLQWRGDTNQVVFNDQHHGKNIARMVDVESGSEVLLPDAIGSVSPDGKWAVGYSFTRVDRCMPGYGYQDETDDQEANAMAPKNNGIHIINLDTRERRLLITLADLAGLHPESSMRGSRHFVTHALFSPGSTRFAFLHRWIKNDVNKRWSRMISCGIDGSDLYVFPTVDMVSHLSWRDDQHVLAYCRVRQFGDQYVLFRDQQSDVFTLMGHRKFSSDGHPSFDSSGRWMVTDTYPDRRRRQKLLLYDTYQDIRYDLCSLPMPKQFQSPSAYAHWSCDLHPRWDRLGRYICFDATYTGKRSLCTIDLGEPNEYRNILSLETS